MIEVLFILTEIGILTYLTYEHTYLLFHFAQKFFKGEKPDEIKDSGATFFIFFIVVLAGLFMVYLIFIGQLE